VDFPVAVGVVKDEMVEVVVSAVDASSAVADEALVSSVLVSGLALFDFLFDRLV